MYGKIQITGTIEVITGMHIGGSSAFAAIGAVDSPLIKDSLNNLPMIPGSSLKGKLRTLLARAYNTEIVNPDKDDERIARLFGTAAKDKIRRSRILISDMFISNADELRKRGIQSITEVKFENTINRATAVANPRQIERVIRGAKFPVDIIYEAGDSASTDEIVEDFETLGTGLKLLQYDYIGGSGSRGYGKIKIDDIHADNIIGNIPDEVANECEDILAKAVKPA